MNDREAIAAAKMYVSDIYADEQIGSPRLEEFEHMLSAGNWVVTLSFPRPWDTPRTRAQEVLENLGAASPLQTFQGRDDRRRRDRPVDQEPPLSGGGRVTGTVLIDSNLLVLLIVGATSRGYIAAHKNTKGRFDTDDFDVLTFLVKDFSEIVLVPHIVAETSSLIRQIGEPRRTEIQRVFAQFVSQTYEVPVASVDGITRRESLDLEPIPRGQIRFEDSRLG